jgi:hypothetical protein
MAAATAGLEPQAAEQQLAQALRQQDRSLDELLWLQAPELWDVFAMSRSAAAAARAESSPTHPPAQGASS